MGSRQSSWLGNMVEWQSQPELLGHPEGGAGTDTLYQHLSLVSRAGSQSCLQALPHTHCETLNRSLPQEKSQLPAWITCGVAGFSGFWPLWREAYWEQWCPEPPDTKHPLCPKPSPEFSACYLVWGGSRLGRWMSFPNLRLHQLRLKFAAALKCSNRP